jgi:hypothetical protein
MTANETLSPEDTLIEKRRQSATAIIEIYTDGNGKLQAIVARDGMTRRYRNISRARIAQLDRIATRGMYGGHWWMWPKVRP